MNISLFNFYLPEHFIAKFPAQKRDLSKLLIYNRENDLIIHTRFKNIVNYLDKNDLIILNDVKVIPARVYGYKETGGKVEILLTEKLDNVRWKCLIKASKKLKKCSKIFFDNSNIECIIENFDEKLYIIKFNKKLDYNDLSSISAQIPIPPYLKRREAEIDNKRYQTVYSNESKQGAVAAPTAGLHFTNEIFELLKGKGVDIVKITLYVGIGTFMPVRVTNIKNHKMHKEKYEISNRSAEKINNAIKNKKKIVAVGTTTVRSLEDNFFKFGFIKPGTFFADIFIYPGFKFNVINKLVTNFHLPESTLLMLVSAFAGRENILKCYEVAKLNRYKFFSYGDCMFII